MYVDSHLCALSTTATACNFLVLSSDHYLRPLQCDSLGLGRLWLPHVLERPVVEVAAAHSQVGSEG